MVEKNSNRSLVRYDIAGALQGSGLPCSQPAKRLRRMPHLFSRLLELPVDADALVQVQEDPSSFTFKVNLPPPLPQLDCIHADIIHIAPGLIKVCVAGVQIVTAHLEELDVPLWRFRLPASCLPEASTAACDDDGLLVLTIPKSLSEQDASPSLLQPYQVPLKSPFSLYVDLGPAIPVDDPVPEFAAESVRASLRDSNSFSTSMHQDDARSHDARLTSTHQDDVLSHNVHIVEKE